LRIFIEKKDDELEARPEETLTLVQRAKYLIFATSFYRELRDNLEKARIQRERRQQKIKK
jgi:hypothetical protein